MPGESPRSRDERLVIGVTGHIGAGKTSAGRYLESRHGFQYLRYSEVLSKSLAKDSESKTDLQEFGWNVMAGGMQGELNQRLINEVRAGANVAVDGLRHPIDYESLTKSFLSSFHLLYIDSPPEVRWARLKERGTYASIDAFEKSDTHPVEQHIDSLRAHAAVVIRNTGSFQDLYLAVDRAIRTLRRESQA